MPILYIMVGPPASGKSTIVKLLRSSTLSPTIICPDEIRLQYPGWGDSNNNVFRYAHEWTRNELREGQHVVFDATNTVVGWRRPLINIAQMQNCPIVAVIMDTPLHVCLERHHRRQQSSVQSTLTDEIIGRYVQSYRHHVPSLEEGFTALVTITEETPDPLALILSAGQPPTTL